jgi:hypothetical protein
LEDLTWINAGQMSALRKAVSALDSKALKDSNLTRQKKEAVVDA